MSTAKDLKTYVPHVGRVEWIGVSDATKAPIQSLQEADVELGTGIVGEHHASSGNSWRQVTLIQQEHLPVIAAILGRDLIDPSLLRRNLVISGINLIALKQRKFCVGKMELEGTGPCEPCSRMEWNLGDGGYAAMVGHGGICAVVRQAGTIRVGDEVRVLDEAESE